jgi:hypothetical protein
LIFLRHNPKSGLIHAIGWRKSQKALLGHGKRKEGRFWDRRISTMVRALGDFFGADFSGNVSVGKKF